jgi:hypothetical protein
VKAASRLLCSFGLSLVGSAALTPAYAQFYSYYQHAPVYLPGLPPPPPNSQHLRVLPRVIPEQARRPLELEVRPRRKPENTPQVARKARPMNERINPLPLLLSDDTLRSGDIVMFPDGPRVFTGSTGGRHRLQDFVAAAKRLSKSALAALKRVQPGTNDAWEEKVLSRTGGLRDQEVASNPYKDKIAPAP